MEKKNSTQEGEKHGHAFKWMLGQCSKYDSTSLYFSLKVLLMQQIGSIRTFIKGRGPGIFSCYYKHDPRLLSQQNRGKIEPKDFNSCLIRCLATPCINFNQLLEILVTAALFHYKIPTSKYFSDVPVHLRSHWIGWKNNEKKLIIDATAVRHVYVYIVQGCH